MKKLLNILFVSSIVIIFFKLLNFKNKGELYEQGYYDNEEEEEEKNHNIIEILDYGEE